MSNFTFADVNGLAGSLALGMTHAGGDMLYRAGYLGLGQNLVRANASLWGADWEDRITPDAGHFWEAWYNAYGRSYEQPDVIVAVPPCSGFSLLTGKGTGAGKGSSVGAAADHPSNDCMWSTARYAGSLAPQIYLFESVQGAYRRGREVMQGLRSELERLSGKPYTLTHWLHDAATLGAPTSRQRYLFVAVQGTDPFTVTPWQEYAVDEITTMSKAIEDLAFTSTGVGDVVKAAAHNPYEKERERADGMVDGHYNYMIEKTILGKPLNKWHREFTKLTKMMNEAQRPWRQASPLPEVMRDLVAAYGPQAMLDVFDPYHGQRLIDNDFNMGAYFPSRECWDSLCSVIAGDGPEGHVHPTLDRLMTYRECARINGWPDDVRVDYDKKTFGKEKIAAVWGKAVTVTVADHVGEEVSARMRGDISGKTAGELIGDREWLIDDSEPSRKLRAEAQRRRKLTRYASI